MAVKMNITRFLKELQKGRAAWEALLAEVPDDRLTTPGAAGTWTVKDIIAHITWHEREMIQLLDGRTLAHSSDLWLLPTDERNAAIYEENKERSLSDVLEEAPRVYHAMLALIQTLSDDELRDPSKFEQMPSDWVPWEIIASNTYGHYQQHTPDIQAWIEEQTGADRLL